MKQKKISWVAMLLCCAFILTACQAAPSKPADYENSQSIVTLTPQPNQEEEPNNVKGNNSSANLELVHSSDGTAVEETLTTSDGKKIILNATVSTKNIENIQQYRYELLPVTEELRETLFAIYFGNRVSEAVYDELNDVWELHNSNAVGDYYLYSKTTPMSGETVPGEEIFMLEYREVNLYPFDDNLLSSVSDCKVSISLEDAVSLCDHIVEAIAPQDSYIADTVLPYGNQGRRPYYHIFYRRTIDGMPITGYNDIHFKVDSDGIQEISGTIYSLTPQPLSDQILSLEDAINVLRDNANIVNFYNKDSLPIGAISMEYMVTLTETQEAVIKPVWRFQIGNDTDSLGINRRYVLGVDAVTGNLAQGERGMNF